MGATSIEWTTDVWNPVISPDGEWAAVPFAAGYSVSRAGQVRSTRRVVPRILRGVRSGSGHLYVFLYHSGKGHKRFVHRLVLEAWVGPCPPGHEARHLNGVPDDNRLENLAWGTHAENMRDRIAHGTMTRGEQRHNARITSEQARVIRSDPRASRVVGAEYGISHTAVQRIRRGERWEAA